MTLVTMHDAKTQLSKLVRRAAAGEEIVIGRAAVPVAKLVRYEPPPAKRRSQGYCGGRS